MERNGREMRPREKKKGAEREMYSLFSFASAFTHRLCRSVSANFVSETLWAQNMDRFALMMHTAAIE